jgi:hypothetical protein
MTEIHVKIKYMVLVKEFCIDVHNMDQEKI